MKLTDEKRKFNYLLNGYIKKKSRNEFHFIESSNSPTVWINIITKINGHYVYQINKKEYKKLKSWQR